MSKKQEGMVLPDVVVEEYAYVLSEHAANRINGEIFEIIEAVGLSQKQEDSMKSMVRKATWSVFHDGIRVRPERYGKLLKEFWEREQIPVAQRNPDYKALH